MNNNYGKKEKLKNRKRIETLFEEGKSVSKYPIKLIYHPTELPTGINIQVGVAVSKRNFKSAVKRNRIKRLLREAYRLNKQAITNNSLGNFTFLFLYLSKEMPTYNDVEKAIVVLLRRFLAANKV